MKFVYFFSLVVCVFDVTSKKTLPNAGSQRFAPLFSIESFIGFFLGGGAVGIALHGRHNFPDQGWNLCPLQWKHRVLTSGLLVKSKVV